MHDQNRRVAILGVHRAAPTGATILIRGVLTDIVQGLVVEIEIDPPHRITGIGLELVPQPARDSATASLGTNISEELGLWLQRLADADVFSGAVGVAKDGELLFAQAYGEANKDFTVPNTLDTAFNLGSMNKMFTAVAIAQLVVRDEQPSFAPGTQWQYSNTGFLILGAVIEAVTGQNYFAYVQTQLHEPLGMHRTAAYELDRVNWNLAVGYDKEFTDTGVMFRNNLFQHVIRGGPAGGGYSTVADLVS